MAEVHRAEPGEETSHESGGYRQELKRTLGSFQVFAISFAFISVAVGIFGTYDDVLQAAGPVGIWLWIIAAVGQTLVALVIAQFAARIPLTGSSYQWASRLANPTIGWGFGWLSYCYLGIAVVAVDNAMASQAFMPLVGLGPDEHTARLITLALLLIQAFLAIASTRIVAILNAGAVGVEVVIVGVLVIALLIAVAITGSGSVHNLTSFGVAAGGATYFGLGGGLMLAMIMGLATLVGFDAAANLAEEAKDPYRSVPRAIVGSVVTAGVLGMLFLIALTVAITDIERISRSDSPVAQILHDQLGRDVEMTLLVAINFAFFACGMVTMVTGARLVFAMARDARFPAHRLMRRVDPAHTDAGPGDDPDSRRRGRPDVRAAGQSVAGADHGVDHPADAHLRGDGRPLFGSAHAARTQTGGLRPRALRAADRDCCAGLAGPGAGRAGNAGRSAHPPLDRRRFARRGWAVLARQADVRSQIPRH